MNYGLLKKYTKNLNILFVEDDTDFRKEFSELLLDIFPKVTSAVDGLHALNKYKEFHETTNSYYDLIISDIKMPNLDGVELIDSIYKIKEDQLVIILSARNEFNYLLPLVNLGIHQFFTKPIDFSSFLEDISPFIFCSIRELPVPPYLADFVALAISCFVVAIYDSLFLASSNCFSTDASSFVFVQGRTILDLLVISLFTAGASFGWFTRKFLAHVTFPLGAGKSPTGFTNDLPPLPSPTPETPRLTFF